MKINNLKKVQNAEERFYRRDKTFESTTAWEQIWKQSIFRQFGINFEFFRDKSVLEIGCGAFGCIHYINAPCFKTGIDPLCYNYRDIYNAHPGSASHLTCFGEFLPFGKGVFDVVMSFNVIDHGINPENIIKEAKRVLKRNGIFLLYIHTFNIPKFIRSKLWVVDKPHPHHLSDEEVRSYLKNAGFNIGYHSISKISAKSKFLNLIKRRDENSFKFLVGSFFRIQNSVYRCVG